MTKRAILIIFFYQVFLVAAYSQIKNIGVPYIRNYPKREYKAGTQNWGIEQDRKGFIYFANNGGLYFHEYLSLDLQPAIGFRKLKSISYRFQ